MRIPAICSQLNNICSETYSALAGLPLWLEWLERLEIRINFGEYFGVTAIWKLILPLWQFFETFLCSDFIYLIWLVATIDPSVRLSVRWSVRWSVAFGFSIKSDFNYFNFLAPLGELYKRVGRWWRRWRWRLKCVCVCVCVCVSAELPKVYRACFYKKPFSKNLVLEMPKF